MRLARLLHRVHALPPAGKPFDALAAANRYAEDIGGERADCLLAQVKKSHSLLEPAGPALCHNDLVSQGERQSQRDRFRRAQEQGQAVPMGRPEIQVFTGLPCRFQQRVDLTLTVTPQRE